MKKMLKTILIGSGALVLAVVIALVVCIIIVRKYIDIWR